MVQDGIFENRGRVSAEGALPGRHLVENQAEGEQVGARIQLLAAHLLRRHVARGAHRRAGAGEMGVCRGGWWKSRASAR